MRQIIILIISISVIYAGCKKEECNCKTDEHVTSLNDRLVNKVINAPNKHKWSKYNEPLLFKKNNESFRLAINFWELYIFKIIRIEKSDNQYNLHVKEYYLNPRASEVKDSLLSSYSRVLLEKDWEEIVNSLQVNCFWTKPVWIEGDNRNLTMNKGSQWVIEGKVKGNNCTKSDYHFTYRNSPFRAKDSLNLIKIYNLLLKHDPEK